MIRRPDIDPVEIIAIAIPVLIEAVLVTFTIACAIAGVAIYATRGVAT